MQRVSAMQRASRDTRPHEYPWNGRPPFSEPPSAAAAAVNRRHEHSATAAERFRSGRHRSDGGTCARPKVPPAIGDRASYPA